MRISECVCSVELNVLRAVSTDPEEKRRLIKTWTERLCQPMNLCSVRGHRLKAAAESDRCFTFSQFSCNIKSGLYLCWTEATTRQSPCCRGAVTVKWEVRCEECYQSVWAASVIKSFWAAVKPPAGGGSVSSIQLLGEWSQRWTLGWSGRNEENSMWMCLWGTKVSICFHLTSVNLCHSPTFPYVENTS